MAETRWLVELLIPSGKYELRPVVTEQTAEQFDAMVHASVANLLAWKPDESPVSVSVLVAPWVVQTQQIDSQRAPWRMIMGHTTEASLAAQIATELQALFPTLTLPWNQELRHKFDAYIRRVGGVSRWDGQVLG
jgi:hypothetical protein